MNGSKFLFFLLVGLFFFSGKPHIEEMKHPFHVSSAEIVYTQKSKQLQITAKFFVDDFESALKREFKREISLESHQIKALNPLIEAYIHKNLKLTNNNKLINIKIIGAEIERESCLVYLESSPISMPKQLDVFCSFLYTIFNDQMNIVHVNIGQKKESSKLNYPDTKLILR